MKLRIILTYILFLLLGIGSSPAETVSQKEARKMAATFFNAANGRVMADPVLVWNGKKLTTDRLFTPFYVYNNPAGGFVVISAENKAFPILAYSMKDSFDPNALSAELTSLLRQYARHIELIRYDSRIPEEAIAAWQDYNGYLAALLDAPYRATDPVYTPEEVSEMLEYIWNAPYEQSSFLFSDIYEPSQWEEMIDNELDSQKSVALGILDAKTDMSPATVYGKKGRYYKLRFGSAISDAMYLLLPTEFLSEGLFARLGKTPSPAETEEEPPFMFYENFVAEVAREQEEKDKEMERQLKILEPQLINHGSGRYTIYLPTQARLARVYSLSGAMVRQHTYRAGNPAVIDIMAEPKGFYFALIYDVDGKPYGFKLGR